MHPKTKSSAWALAALTLIAAPAVGAEAPGAPLSADLDGDGKPEQVSLQQAEGASEFVLKAGGATLKGDAKDTEASVSIVDLDSGDKRKEIAVTLGNTDADHAVLLYGFDGKALRPLGTVHSLTEARGNGIILSDSWQGFWNRREKYTVDPKTGKVQLVPQDLYYVGQEATVKQPFPLVRSRTDASVIATLAQGSKIQVLAAGEAGGKPGALLYLVKSSTGLLGWASLKDLQAKVDGLGWAG